MYLLLFLIAGFLLFLYFYTNTVTEQEIDIYLNNELNREVDSHQSRGCAESNFTILHLSDFHFTRESLLEDKIKRKVAELDYDLVALTGDYLEDRGNLADFFRYLDSLNFAAPVVAVAGNHDYNNHFNDLKLRFESRGIKFLHNESLTYHCDSCRINLIGVGSPNRGRDDLETALQRWRPARENFIQDEDNSVYAYSDNTVSINAYSDNVFSDNTNPDKKSFPDNKSSNIKSSEPETNQNKKSSICSESSKNSKSSINSKSSKSSKISESSLNSKSSESSLSTKSTKSNKSSISIENSESSKSSKNSKINESSISNETSENSAREINIILSHTHEIIESLGEESENGNGFGIDLILTGDTHGGQINIPLLSRVVLPLVFNRDRNFIAGRYNHGGTEIYINRGLGTTILPLRFNSRPEITLIRLKH